jgi:methionine sulfoxide reductase heme-binding subunit
MPASAGSTRSPRSGRATTPAGSGLGALALDLVLAVVATSLLRHRIGLRSWWILHLSSYALWPLAVLHGWGIGGADSRLGWVLALDAGCALAVALALLQRMRADHPDTAARRAMSADLR